MRVTHEFGPVYDSACTTLILGSIPSVKSRAEGFYYGNPQNRFWKVISTIHGEMLPSSLEDKRALCLKHHIALWDVLESCEITGSSDASIRDPEPVDIDVIMKVCKIKHIYTNGATAGKYYDKYLKEKTGIEAITLPSTSPANAAYSLERLIEEWKCIK